MAKATCSIEGCDRPIRSRGWCQAHYMRWYAHGEVANTPIRSWDRSRTCSVDGCDAKHSANGYCAPHNKRFEKYGHPGSSAIRPRVIPDELASYDLVHNRLKNQLGPARNKDCVKCGGRALHWAYDHSCPNEMTDIKGLPFSTDPARYKPMCAPCHKRFDLGRTHHTELQELGSE